MGRRIVYGMRPVEEALGRGSRHVSALLVGKKNKMDRLAQRAAAAHIPVQTVSLADLDLLCASASHQGVAAVCGDFPYWDLEDLLEPEAEPKMLLALDGVTDPQNLGAIIRTALVLGGHGIILPKDRSAQVTPTVVRVSAGASEHLPCARVTNLARALRQCQEAGYWVVGTVEQGGVLPEAVDCRVPLVMVLGSEQKGMRPLVQRQCDALVTMPSASPIASLNVGAAAAALMAEVARQRRSG